MIRRTFIKVGVLPFFLVGALIIFTALTINRFISWQITISPVSRIY